MPLPGRVRKGHSGWIIVAGIFAAIILYNATVAIPVAVALSRDARNEGISLITYRTWAVTPRDITIDLRGIAADKAPLDLFRAFFQTAAELKDRGFAKVTLARQGKAVFIISGDDFRELGKEYAENENPIYMLRTLPEKLMKKDGSPAFGTWKGGWVGVLGKQVGDADSFAADWIAGEPQSSD